MKFKLPQKIKYALVFFFLIFFAALIGQPFPTGYMHPADPLVLLAAVVLPLPHAMVVSAVAGVAVDCIKGYDLLAIITFFVRILMVLAVKGLLKLPAANKFPDLMVAPAALVPIPCYFLGLALGNFITLYDAQTPLTQKIGNACAFAARSFEKDIIQAFGSILIFLLLYAVYKKMKDRRARKAQKNHE